jgi:hypothetical protein
MKKKIAKDQCIMLRNVDAKCLALTEKHHRCGPSCPFYKNTEDEIKSQMHCIERLNRTRYSFHSFYNIMNDNRVRKVSEYDGKA